MQSSCAKELSGWPNADQSVRVSDPLNCQQEKQQTFQTHGDEGWDQTLQFFLEGANYIERPEAAVKPASVAARAR